MIDMIELETEWLRATVLPEVGCKIQSLLSKTTGRQILWQNPRVKPQPYPVDSNFDNYWSGGWDDGFPTCDACTHAGEVYPNLGELRSVAWTVDASNDVSAQFSCFGPISPVRATKTVALDPAAPVIRMQYRIENVGPLPVDFIWGTHPALAVNEHTLFRIPGRTGVVGVSGSAILGTPGQRYEWPHLGPLDMSRAQPGSAGLYCGHYVTGLEEGWFAAEDTWSSEGVLFAFPLETCSTLWLWMCYGGWRGYRDMVVIEPWTSMPVDLERAVSAGTSLVLQPGSEFAVEIRAACYHAPESWTDALKRITEPK